MEFKVCTRCNQELPSDRFSLRSNVKKGRIALRSECKECSCRRAKAHRTIHPEKAKLASRTHRQANLERRKAECRQYKALRREKLREDFRKWRELNRQKAIDSTKRWRNKNYAKVIAAGKAWRDSNPERIIGYQALKYFKEAGITEPPTELLDLKATHIKVTREIRSLKNQTKQTA